jgi:hypothetical protein
MDGVQSPSGRRDEGKNLLSHRNSGPSTVQPSASHYTDWSIPAPEQKDEGENPYYKSQVRLFLRNCKHKLVRQINLPGCCKTRKLNSSNPPRPTVPSAQSLCPSPQFSLRIPERSCCLESPVSFSNDMAALCTVSSRDKEETDVCGPLCCACCVSLSLSAVARFISVFLASHSLPSETFSSALSSRFIRLGLTAFWPYRMRFEASRAPVCQVRPNILKLSYPYLNLEQLLLHPSHFPTAAAGFEPGSGHVIFVVDNVALRQVFSEHFGFPCQFAFHRLLHNHHHHITIRGIG